MTIDATREPRVGRRGLIWKSVGLTPQQEEVVREIMREKRWKFQTLVEEALAAYAVGQKKHFPEREP